MREPLSEPAAELGRVARQDDDGIDIAGAALALAALECPSARRADYECHLDDLAGEVAALGRADEPEERAAALAQVIVGRHRYHGDGRDYDDLDNANLMRVIDRRKGLPVTLGILYLAAARRQGWSMVGLAFPGHFLLRLDGEDGGRVILDPFHGGRLLAAPELRELLKATTGVAAELEPGHYAAVSDRDILLRLQNNIKLRLLRGGDIPKALLVVERMLLFAPQRVPLWREAGLMHLRLGDTPSAIAAIEQFVARSPNGEARHRMSVLLQELRGRLH